MASLTAHQSGDHDRLGFHPDCPLCRQDRLFGVLSPEPLFSRRLSVLLAAGVLAFSTAATGTSVATEPDDHQEGVVLPDEGAPQPGETAGGTATGDSSDELGQGSGGDTALPFEADPVPAGPQDDGGGEDSEDAAPLEMEPTADPDAGLLLSGPDTPGALDAGDAPVPPADPAPLTTPAPPTVPAPDGGAPPIPGESAPPAEDLGQDRRAAAPQGGRRVGARHHKPHERKAPRHRVQERADGVDNGPPPPAPDEARAQPVAQLAEPAPAPATPLATGGFGRFHVVRPGESLWSIATDVLGPGASAAAIATEVRRLWKLNAERIGTGDPNLLVVGVRLRLR